MLQPTPLEQLIRKYIAPRHAGLLTREIIEQYQLNQLHNVLAYCKKRSPFYKQHLSRSTKKELTSLEDLHTLPFVTAQDIQDHGSDMLCVGQDDIARIITMHSSGTTGAPKRLYFTDEDLQATLHFFYWGMQAIAQPGWKTAILLPGATPDSTGDLLARALRKFGVEPHIFGLVPEPEKILAELVRLKAEVIVGFPVQILALARLAELRGTPLTNTRSILLCSDYIPYSLSAQLKEILDCLLYSHYGTIETGLGGGVECRALCGQHLRESDLLVEIIDLQTRKPLQPGHVGEIVITTLTRRGMPLVRYRTGDQARLLPGSCPCGSSIARLDKVMGRTSNQVVLANGEILSMQLLDETLFILPGILDFAVTVNTTGVSEVINLTLTAPSQLQQKLTFQAQELLSQLPQLNQVAVKIAANKHVRIASAKRIITDNR